jgi:small-conductance mechanosensitive channel
MKLNNKALVYKWELPSISVRLFLWLLLISPGISFSQATSDVDPSLSTDHKSLSAVRVDGEVLFYVRGISTYTADTRAKTIEKRIRKAADNYAIPPDSVKAVKDEERLKIYAGKEFIMNVYQIDADVESINLEVMGEIVVERTKISIREYRKERAPEVIKANAFKAGLAIALLIVCLLFFVWIFRRLNEAFKNRIRNRIDKLENVSFKLIQSNQLLKILHLLYQVIRMIIIVIITVSFVDYILSLFPWTKAASVYLLELVLDPIRNLGRSFIDYLPSLIFLIIIILVTRYFLKLFRLFFTSIAEQGIVINNFDPEWAMPTFDLVKLLIIVFAVVVAFPYIPGSNSSAFQGISVFLGVLFSLGSSSFVANVIAGYSMTYRRAFKKGDRIQVNEFTGFVEEQSLMVTRLRSVKNEEIVIPNSSMLNSSIVNYSLLAKDKGLILHTTVGIGYETPWRQVDAMLKLAADRTTGLLKDPPPFVLKKELGDFAVVYEINAYCNDVDKMFVYYTELHQNILDIFNENNVQIMTPAYEADPEIPKVVPKDQWNAPLASDQQV